MKPKRYRIYAETNAFYGEGKFPYAKFLWWADACDCNGYDYEDFCSCDLKMFGAWEDALRYAIENDAKD